MRTYQQAYSKEVFASLPDNRVGELDRQYIEELFSVGFHNSDKSRMVSRFEKAFAEKFGVKVALACSNGTATMHACLIAAGIGPGDEVIVPTLTMASTAFVVLQCFAVPVFADIDPRSFTISVEDIKRKITPFTKAIIPVSIFGQPCDIDPIMEIAKLHDLVVIEDNAQCFLSKYKDSYSGTRSHAGSFSFQGSKHMTTSGEGGMVVTNDEDYADRIRKASALGYAGISSKPGSITIPRDVRQDPDFKRHEGFGYNYRMPSICAALGLGQLARLDSLVEARRIVAYEYQQVLEGCNWIVALEELPETESSQWAFATRLDPEKTDVDFRMFRKKFIENGGDGLYSCWCPVHLEPVFQKMNFYGSAYCAPNFHPLYKGSVKSYNVGDCPVTEEFQPHMMLFKTSFTTYEKTLQQAEALRKTVDFFGRR